MNDHPIRIHVRDDLRRSRLTVFFRLLLFVPHYIWLGVWTYLAEAALVISWVIAIFMGRLPRFMQRFLTSYLRYQAHVYAYLMLIGNPFPGFIGKPGTYPIDIEFPNEPVKQNRLTIFFRLLLVLPVLFLSAVLGVLLFFAAVGGWFFSLIMGRMPRGLRDAGAYAIRYQSQVYGYLFLVTGTYPNSSPLIGTLVEEPAMPAAALPGLPPPPAPALPPTPAPAAPAPRPEPAAAPEQASERPSDLRERLQSWGAQPEAGEEEPSPPAS